MSFDHLLGQEKIKKKLNYYLKVYNDNVPRDLLYPYELSEKDWEADNKDGMIR